MSAVNVHTHTMFSLMDGLSRPSELVERVKELGQSAICITDHGTTSGLVEVYNECQKNDIKMVFGCEHYLTHSINIQARDLRHINFWAENQTGYNNLLRLTSEAHQNFYCKPRVDFNMIKKYSDGLIMSSACLGGWLRGESNTVRTNLLERFIEMFPNRLYIEIHTYSIDEQKDWNLRLVQIAKQYNLPMIAACDAHYVRKEDAPIHKLWVTQGKEREDGYYQHEEFYLHSEQEMREALSYLPDDVVDECIANTQALADRCNVTIPFGENHYPKIKVSDEEEAVRKIMREHWVEKVPKDKWKEYAERINNEEIPVLKKAGYLQYLLIVEDFLRGCRKKEIPLGYARGSVGGCLVAYLMDITKIDSIKYDLSFSRFCHLERVTPADVDLDCSQLRRHECFEYLKERYGSNRVFKSRTYGLMKARAALKRAGKALGYEDEYTKELSKSIQDDEDSDFKGLDIERHLIDSITNCPDDLSSLAKRFVGVLQNYGIHAGAALIFPDDAENYTAIEKNKDDYVCAYEFHTLEALGCLKLDVLGVKTTDVISSVIDNVDDDIVVPELPLDDKATFDMLCRGDTKGVFQIEGSGFTRLVKEVKPKNFNELAPLLAVYRPGIIGAGLLDEYINRAKGNTPVSYLIPELEPILKSTHGIIVFQEQIIEIAKRIAGYTGGQADMLRRAVGRKKPEEMAKIKPDFIKRAMEHGQTKEKATQLFELIEFFAAYGFNKSHAYGYCMLSYATAYLKAHYPLQFMVALINSEDNQENVVPYFNECKSIGIQVLPPDMSKRNLRWIVEGDAIRVGLSYIKGIGNGIDISAVDTFKDIIQNNNKRIVEGLIKSGALDYLGKDRGWMMCNLKSVQDTIKRKEQCREKIELNESMLKQAVLDDNQKDIRKYTRQLEAWKKKLSEVEFIESAGGSYNKIAGEMESLSFSFGELPKVKQGVLKRIYTKNDKNNHEMGWCTFDTEYGEIRCTLFSRTWKHFKDILVIDGKYKFASDAKGILTDIRKI